MVEIIGQLVFPDCEAAALPDFCAICGREVCDNEAMCALFWNLDIFNDYEPEDEIDPYDRYEEEYD